MNVDYRYEHVSGTTADRLYTVGVRFDSDYVHHSTQECWVIEMERETIHISNGHPSTYTGVWASASGEVFVADGNGGVQLGSPQVGGASVKATILGEQKAKKVLVFKKKRRKGYRRKRGHRQIHARVRIDSISA